jgi:cysteinyl-tRNA synthetase
MRLYDTFTRSVAALPPPPGPIRMYFCGPTVYQRIHVGNAVPFVLAMWLERWLDESGYETKLVVNITDINDKIYAAAPGASAQLASDASRWYVEDTDRLGLGRPDVEPTAVETVADQIAMIGELVESGFAYESDGDVYFRVTRYSEYGRLRSRTRARRIRATSPSGRRRNRARTRPGSHRGVAGAPAGTSSAPSCRRSTSDPSSRSTAAVSTSSFHTTRTRLRSHARSATGSRKSGCTTGC